MTIHEIRATYLVKSGPESWIFNLDRGEGAKWPSRNISWTRNHKFQLSSSLDALFNEKMQCNYNICMICMTSDTARPYFWCMFFKGKFETLISRQFISYREIFFIKIHLIRKNVEFFRHSSEHGQTWNTIPNWHDRHATIFWLFLLTTPIIETTIQMNKSQEVLTRFLCYLFDENCFKAWCTDRSKVVFTFEMLLCFN